MRSHRSSRTGFRKNLHSLVVLLILVPVLAPAEIVHTTQLDSLPSYLEVRMSVRGVEPDELFANLADGLSARMEYSIRVLQARDQPMRLLGSRTLREFRLSYELGWDPFRRRYTISTQDGGLYTFRDEAAVRSFFFTVPGYRIPWSAIASDNPETGMRRFVIETRATYEPIVFVPGLTILSIFLPWTRQQSAWISMAIEVDR